MFGYIFVFVKKTGHLKFVNNICFLGENTTLFRQFSVFVLETSVSWLFNFHK